MFPRIFLTHAYPRNNVNIYIHDFNINISMININTKHQFLKSTLSVSLV